MQPDLDVPALIVAAGTAIVAAAEVAAPFDALLHAWEFALAISLCGAGLLWYGCALLFAAQSRRRSPALASLGGALLAALVASSAFLVGQPERVPAAPGQAYRPPHGGATVIRFPDVPETAITGGSSTWPDTVTVEDAFGSHPASAGDVLRSGGFVLRIDDGPIAYVDARSPAGRPVTITQPDGAAFLSPFLTFSGMDGAQPEDYFALPALHRTVQVDYWAGLPAKGIDVPFLVLRIAEENGGGLFEGVAVSGRPLRKAGVGLTFRLGTYPVVTASSAPPLVPFWAGIAMVAAGIAGRLFGSRTGR